MLKWEQLNLLDFHSKRIFIEASIGLVLSVHGLFLLSQIPSQAWQWVMLSVLMFLSLIGFFPFNWERSIAHLRFIFMIALCWLMTYTTGGTASFFPIWYFVIAPTYALLLETRKAIVLPLILASFALSFVPLSQQGSPSTVVVSRAMILVYMSWLATFLNYSVKQYTKQLETSIKRLNLQGAILDNLSEGIQLLRKDDAVVVYSNLKLGTMYGYSRIELESHIDKFLFQTLKLNNQNEAIETIQNLKINDVWMGEILNAKKDGTKFWSQVSVSPFTYSEHGELLISIHQDITHRKQTELDLRASERRFRHLFEQENDAVALVDLEGKLIVCNQRAEQLIGYRISELRELRFFELQDSELVQQAEERFQQFIQGKSQDIYESSFVNKSGERIDVEVNAEPILDEEGQVSYIQYIVRDIRQRKAMETALFEGKRKWETLFEVLPVGVALLDANSEIVEMNPALARVLDLPTDDLMTANLEQRQYIRPDNTPFEIHELPSQRAIIENKVIEDVVVGAVKENGEVIWTSGNAAPLKLPGANVVITVSDITERKKLEEASKANEAQLSHLMNTLTDVVLKVELPKRRIKFANRATSKILGYTPDELIGKTSEMLFLNQKDFVEFGKRADFVVANGDKQVYSEVEMIRKNGEPFWASLASAIETNDDLVEVITIIRDINEQKLAETVIKESERRYRNLFEQSYDAIFILDIDGNYLDVNQKGCQLLGHERDEYVGKAYMEWVVPSEIPNIYDILQALKEGKTIPIHERRFITKQGKEIITEVNIGLIQDDTGKAPYFHSIVRDISERKRAELALRESERRFRTLAESLPDTIYIFDVESSEIEYINHNTFLGYSLEEIKRTQSLTNKLMDKDHHRVASYLQDLTTRKFISSSTILYRLMDKQNNWHWIQNRDAILERDKAGTPKKILITLTDMTETLKAERRFQALIERSSDLIITADSNGIITYVSPASKVVTSYDTDELLRRNVFDSNFLPMSEEANTKIKQYFSQIVKHSELDTIEAEISIIDKDGQTRWLKAVGTNLLSNPDVKALIVNLHDISKLKEAVAREQRENNFVKILLELSTITPREKSLTSIFKQVIEQLNDLFPNDGISIRLIDGERAEVVAAHFSDRIKLDKSRYFYDRLTLKEVPLYLHMLSVKLPILISDTRENPIWPKRGVAKEVLCYLASPIVLSGKVLGFITLYSAEADKYTDEMTMRLFTIASYIGITIHNAQMYNTIRDRAIQEERQYLAHELHDVVSQALFSASMIAESLPRLLDHDVETVRAGLDDLKNLSKGALAEMRILLLELRPSALQDTSLDVLLNRLIDDFKLHANGTEVVIDIQFAANNILPDAKLASYRIAQEALTNILKHAQSTHVHITCQSQQENFKLIIEDDGIGFDFENVTSSHLGLRIMQERAKQVNLTLSIVSQIGIGTRIVLVGDLS